MIDVIVAGAGSGSRFSNTENKLLMRFPSGKTVLRRSVEAFMCLEDLDRILVTARPSDVEEYKRTLEGELEELCTSVRGVGRCRVTVTFSEGESLQYKGSSLIGSTPPRVMGVTVVCEGADRDSVREAISECMCSLFDIRSNRVCVLKMK